MKPKERVIDYGPCAHGHCRQPIRPGVALASGERGWRHLSGWPECEKGNADSTLAEPSNPELFEVSA